MKNAERLTKWFYESGGVCPQKHLCKFASAALARTFVCPRLHKAANTQAASVERQCVKRYLTYFYKDEAKLGKA